MRLQFLGPRHSSLFSLLSASHEYQDNLGLWMFKFAIFLGYSSLTDYMNNTLSFRDCKSCLFSHWIWIMVGAVA